MIHTFTSVKCKGVFHRIEAHGRRIIFPGHQLKQGQYRKDWTPDGECGRVLRVWSSCLERESITGKPPRRLHPHMVHLLKEIHKSRFKAQIVCTGSITPSGSSVSVCTYDLRVYGGGLSYSPYKTGRKNKPVVLDTGSGMGPPKWMERLCNAINHASPATWEELEAIDDHLPRARGRASRWWDEHWEEEVDELMKEMRG